MPKCEAIQPSQSTENLCLVLSMKDAFNVCRSCITDERRLKVERVLFRLHAVSEH